MTYKLPAPSRLPSNGYNTVAGYSDKQIRQAYAEGLAAQTAQIPDNPCLNDYVHKAIRAHMAKLEANGYGLVPLEPTQAMADAGWKWWHDWSMHSDGSEWNRGGYKAIYKAMIAAAPSAAPSKENGNG